MVSAAFKWHDAFFKVPNVNVYIQSHLKPSNLYSKAFNRQFRLKLKTFSSEECHDVPKTHCRKIPIKIPHEKCKQVPEKQCIEVPYQVPKKIPHEVCQDIPYEQCHDVPEKIPKQIPKASFK